MLAGVGSLPDTIEDRAVVITMQRRSPDDQISKFRTRRDTSQVREMSRVLEQWVAPLAGRIGAAGPPIPAGLNDRAEDVWEPLLAVADATGGDWPQRAAARRLCSCPETLETMPPARS